MISRGQSPGEVDLIRRAQVVLSGWTVDVSVSRSVRDDEWDRFVESVAGGHHVQSSEWAEVKFAAGWRPLRIMVRSGGEIVAGAQMLTRRLPVGAIAYLDHGPLAVDVDPTVMDLVIDEIKRVTTVQRVRLLILQPPDTDPQLHDRLRGLGFGESHAKAALGATVVVDLSSELDEILAGMRSKTRYNVRLGQRSGITVRVGDEDDVRVFHRMLQATAGRQGFLPTPLEGLLDMYRIMAPAGHLELLVAEVDGEVVAGILTVLFGDRVIYKRGAWSGEHGDRRPNETLHWTAMQRAKAAGFRRYDFDGIEPDVARALLAGEKPDIPPSVTRFKVGFGGDIVLIPPAVSYVPNRLLRLAHDAVYPRVARLGIVKRTVNRLRTR
jgi:peptidoglycan pentaglycine glycine transferase (the first glycine)